MILLRQVTRSVWRNKKAYIACVVLMAVGILVFVAYGCLYRNLAAAMDDFYRSQRFGDVFAAARAIPLSVADEIGDLEGVAETGATIVSDARVQFPGDNRIITLRISSFIPGEDGRINNFLILEGAEPGDGGILVGDSFAAAHGLHIGDPISLVAEGRSFTQTVTGIVQSPEYVYAIPDTGQFMPDPTTFSFGYMTASRLGTITGKSGTATNLSLLLEEGESFAALEHQLQDILNPYGLTMLVERKNQPSHSMLQTEVDALGSMSTSMPMVFILMAVIILYIMLKRMIEQERGQIGTLKALGFTDRAIMLHYMGYGGITGAVGGALGVALGIMTASAATDVFMFYFSLPALQNPPAPSLVATGFALAFGSGLLGAYMGTRGILKLLPAEAMRPPSPPAIRGDAVGRIPLLRALLTSFGFMSVRNITRNPFRSAFVVLGMAFAFAITAFMASYSDMFDSMMLNQFTKVELFNAKISLKAPAAYTGAVEAASALEGVHRVEGLLELPAEMRHGHLKKTTSVTAIEHGSALYMIYDDENGLTLPPPSGGMILSDMLAEDLQAKRGDLLTMRTPYTGDTDIPVPVLDVIKSNMGSSAYIRLDSLWSLLDAPPCVSALIVDASDTEAIKSALVEAGNVSAITDQDESKRIYTEMIGTYSALMNMLMLAGVAVAFAIITNTATISLSERSREYATMRVLGMHPREVGQVVSFEYWVLALASFPFGILITRILKEGMAGIMEGTDMFSMPVSTSARSYMTAAALCAVAVALSNWSARRKIAKFDMVEVLKERE